MRYRILGTTRVLKADGTPVPVGGARLRGLLTVLALRPGRTVPTPVLVGEVWAGEPPADAPAALQALVRRLRRAIGPDLVVSEEGGYRLVAEPDDIDLLRFDRLATQGARALADGDPVKAGALLDDALALWQDPVLADLADRGSEGHRWEARHREVSRAALAARVARGDAEGALPELTALCDAHPLDEPVQVLRLRALRDAGRGAEALAGYEAVRRALAASLGTDPGPELRALHAELLRGAPARPARPAAPGPGPDPARAHGPAPAPRPAVRGNLRARLTSFVGREEDIEDITARLGSERLVTLLGPGGSGKTRLSQEAAERVAAGLPDGAWMAELAPVDDPEAVPEAVAAALGARTTVLRGGGAEELRAVTDRHGGSLARLVEHCAPRRMLLVLDNCEHVITAAAGLVEQLLAYCPGLTVLATSREPLGVPGESVRAVEPLPQPVAMRLLAERGSAVRTGFDMADDPEAAAEICRRLDGLPLAIELAAARLRLLTPRQIADRLDDRFALLTGGARTVLPRQQTLRAVVDWSWDLLDAGERAVLGRLSVFSGGCELAAAEAVCGTPGGPDVLDVLGSLVDKSLVVAAPGGAGAMRYRLLETVAEYAGERLDESGGRPAAERAHLTYHRELARTADPELRGPGQAAAIARISADYENLRTALRHAVAVRDEHEALCLVLSLVWYWQIHDLRDEARIWSNAVAALGPDPFEDTDTPVPPLYEPCTAAPPPMAPEVLVEARREIRVIMLTCMDLELERWQTPAAKALLEAITRVYSQGLPQSCRTPGNLWFYAMLFQGEARAVHAAIDRTIAACRALGYRWELAAALQSRANILANDSALAADARVDADESLRIFGELGDSWGTAEALSARAEAAERVGDYARAADDHRGAIRLARRLGAHSQVAVLTLRLGNVLAEAGETAEGERLLRATIEDDRGSAHEAMAAGRLFLALLLGRTGRVAEAREQVQLLREGFNSSVFLVFEGFLDSCEGWLLLMEGDYEGGLAQVRATLTRPLDPLARMVAPQMPSLLLLIAALGVAEADGSARAADAARLLGAAHALLPDRFVPGAMERTVVERARTAAVAALGDDAFDAAYAEGGGLSLPEAAALV
ncbi:AfsR/SARP family transcriptional regulator [Streptomyces sp. NPDC050560]|uniref:AfsR/SARP family transcriptional regulator n=1 Tax=Streptomyces sp. NPDC050560 TaxID=3365630 RepID=UPI00378DB608